MLGLAYCYYAQQTYESAAQVLVMQKDPAMVSSSATAAKTTSDAGITEDLLATHLQILQSQLIIDAALQQTIKLSDLNKFKQAYQSTEELTSPNLRYMLARLFNPPPETAKPIDPNTALMPSTTPATATDGSVTSPGTAAEATNPLTAAGNPATPSTPAVTTHSATTHAATTPSPVATHPSVAVTPAHTTPVAGTPTATDATAAAGTEAAAPAIDPATVYRLPRNLARKGSLPKPHRLRWKQNSRY